MEIQHTQQLLRNLHYGGEVFARELVPKLLEDLGGQPSSEIAPPEFLADANVALVALEVMAAMPYSSRPESPRFELAKGMYERICACTWNCTQAIHAGLMKALLQVIVKISAEEHDETWGPPHELHMLTTILQTLAACSLSVETLDAWLMAAMQPPAKFPLLQALDVALSLPENQGPGSFFQFDGLTSGLLGAGCPQWPFASGYTFATWLYMESLAESNQLKEGASPGAHAPLPYTPRLFSFLTQDGAGVEAYFHAPFLVVSVRDTRGDAGAMHFQVTIPTRRWHFVAVEHARTQSTSATWTNPHVASEIRLYVDGVLVESQHLLFPSISAPLTFCCVGTSPPGTMGGPKSSRPRRQCALFANLGPVYIFTEALGSEVMERLYARGPDHVPGADAPCPPNNYTPSAAPHHLHRSASGHSPLSERAARSASSPPSGSAPGWLWNSSDADLDSLLGPVAFRIYHPTLLHDRACPDLSRCVRAHAASRASRGGWDVTSSARGDGKGDARSLGACAAFVRHPPARAFWALAPGAAGAVLPLLLGRADLAGKKALLPSRTPADGATLQLLPLAIHVLVKTSATHDRGRQALYECKAPCILAAVIAAVLQQKCHEHQHRKQQQRPQQRGVDVAAHTDCTAPSDKNISVEMDVVQSSLALESACRRHTDLQREIQRTLLMDLQVWMHAELPAQTLLLDSLLHVSVNQSAPAQSLQSLQLLLDSGGQAYVQGKERGAAASLFCRLASVAHHVVLGLASDAHCLAEAAKMLVAFVGHCQHSHQVACTLRLLERLLRHFHRTNDASFAQALLASHLHQVLVNLVWRQARSASTPTSTNRAQAPNSRHDSCGHGNSDCNVDSSGADVLAECVRLVGCLLAQGHLQPGHEDAFVGEVAFVLRCGQGRLLTQAVYQAALQISVEDCGSSDNEGGRRVSSDRASRRNDRASAHSVKVEVVNSNRNNSNDNDDDFPCTPDLAIGVGPFLLKSPRGPNLLMDALLPVLGAAAPELQLKVMEDVQLLMCMHADNRAAIARRPQWPHWVVRLLLQNEAQSLALGGDGTDRQSSRFALTSRVRESGLKLLEIVVQHDLRGASDSGEVEDVMRSFEWLARTRPPPGSSMHNIVRSPAVGLDFRLDSNASDGQAGMEAVSDDDVDDDVDDDMDEDGFVMVEEEPGSSSEPQLATRDADVCALAPVSPLCTDESVASQMLQQRLLRRVLLFLVCEMETHQLGPAGGPERARLVEQTLATLTLTMDRLLPHDYPLGHSHALIDARPREVAGMRLKEDPNSACESAEVDKVLGQAVDAVVDDLIGQVAAIVDKETCARQQLALLLAAREAICTIVRFAKLQSEALGADEPMMHPSPAVHQICNGSHEMHMLMLRLMLMAMREEETSCMRACGAVDDGHRTELAEGKGMTAAVILQLLQPLLDDSMSPETSDALSCIAMEVLFLLHQELRVAAHVDLPQVSNACLHPSPSLLEERIAHHHFSNEQRQPNQTLRPNSVPSASASPSASSMTLGWSPTDLPLGLPFTVGMLVQVTIALLRVWGPHIARALVSRCTSRAEANAVKSDLHSLGEWESDSWRRQGSREAEVAWRLAGDHWSLLLSSRNEVFVQSARRSYNTHLEFKSAAVSGLSRDAWTRRSQVRERAWRKAERAAHSASRAWARIRRSQDVPGGVAVQKLTSLETSRLTMARASRDIERSGWDKCLSAYLRRLAEHHSLYTFHQSAAASTMTGEAPTTWKVDPTENSLRQRLRLKRCYGGVRFASASAPTLHAPPPSSQGEPTYNHVQAPPPTEHVHNSIPASQRPNAAFPAGHPDSQPDSQPRSAALSEPTDVGLEVDISGGCVDASLAAAAVAASRVADSASVQCVIFDAPAALVQPLRVMRGRLQVDAEAVTFYINSTRMTHGMSSEGSDEVEDWGVVEIGRGHHGVGLGSKHKLCWALPELTKVYVRQYLLVKSAVELFFSDGSNCFFNFESAQERARACSALVAAHPPNLDPVYVGAAHTPDQLLLRSGLTQRWVNREISNFEYLMQLNTIAGRTYNDVTQYPVFPWILADYTSHALDLAAPSTFRDLTKPVGALNPKRLEKIVERYRTFDDPVIPKFHYGSHYSSAGTVLYYLVRALPYTALAVGLQGGRFDHADRMFSDVAATWRGVLEDVSDVKELVPEMFYCPEVLTNGSNYDFGVSQSGKIMHDVVLPPWAKDPHDFVCKQRQALESDYVSMHLHHWVDLIFGYKQRGLEAERAHNVFYYLTYENMVDVDSISDARVLKATQDQIAYFGQTPCQLLLAPHPQRCPRDKVPQLPLSEHPKAVTSYPLPCASRHTGAAAAHVAIAGDVLLEVCGPFSPYLIARHELAPNRPDGKGLPFTFAPDKRVASAFGRWPGGNVLNSLQRQFMGQFTGKRGAREGARSRQALRRLPAVPGGVAGTRTRDVITSTPDGAHLLVGGHVDGCIRVCCAESGSLLEIVSGHWSQVTCLVISSSGGYLVSGSEDCTLAVWGVGSHSPHSTATTAAGHVSSPSASGSGAGRDALTPSRTAADWEHGRGMQQRDRQQVLRNQSDVGVGPRSVGVLELIDDNSLDATSVRILHGPLRHLRGHRASVAAAAVNCDLDTVVSCSSSTSEGLILIHSLATGRLLRRVTGISASLVSISSCGYTVCWDPSIQALHVVSINGEVVARVRCGACAREGAPLDIGASSASIDVTSLAVGADGSFVVVGGSSGAGGMLEMRQMPSLEELHRLPMPQDKGVAGAILTRDDTNLVISLNDGTMLVYTDPAVSVRFVQQMLKIGWAADSGLGML